MRRHAVILAIACVGLSACATTTSDHGTLAELEQVEADIEEIYLDDSLDRAAQSYRRYLEETPETRRTPEAMRRLADLQIEQAYGVIGTGDIVEMQAPEAASQTDLIVADRQTAGPAEPGESELEFEQRATQRQELLSLSTSFDGLLPHGEGETIPAGPREAIETYREILEKYPNYERNDKVLYQMSRAYDEIGQPDEAMAVMDRFVAE